MRPTVSGEMVGTTPSATIWRANSWQSHLARERPYSSGRSHAILTRCSATSGGKDRRSAGALLVLESCQAVGQEAADPFAGILGGQAGGSGGSDHRLIL